MTICVWEEPPMKPGGLIIPGKPGNVNCGGGRGICEGGGSKIKVSNRVIM